MSEERPGWPPPWPDALDEPLEALGTVLSVLAVDESRYAKLVALTREMLDDPGFIQLRDAIARVLTAVPRIESEELAALAAIYFTPTEQEKNGSQDASRRCFDN